jgi:hypothetical protein
MTVLISLVAGFFFGALLRPNPGRRPALCLSGLFALLIMPLTLERGTGDAYLTIGLALMVATVIWVIANQSALYDAVKEFGRSKQRERQARVVVAAEQVETSVWGS